MSDLVEVPLNPVPRGAVSGVIETADGVRLRYAHWRPIRRQARGTVLILQGRAEFIEKYFETVADLGRRGFAAATFDWRGQGGSERLLEDPRKGHIEDFGQYVRDLDAFIEQVLLPDCPPPYYVLGHSAGASVALLSATRARTRFDKMILCAPLLGLALRTPRLTGALTSLLCYAGRGEAYVPGGGATIVQTMPGLRPLLTSDPRRHSRAVASVEARPALGVGSPTIAWVRAALQLEKALDPAVIGSRIPIPVLAVIAGAEVIVSNRAIERFSIGVKMAAHIRIPGARHEVLMERDIYRDQFWAAFDAFIVEA
ncbi:MAG TPA: alpha/beta hydrolase [Afifellaceae bacterium]|nr:alpha/beta hydrolase [Afifellaceae bacterium]